MQIRVDQAVDTPMDELLAVLREPEALARWLPVQDVRVDGSHVELCFLGPRPLRLRLALSPEDDGLAWHLVQGDVSTLQGKLTVAGEGSGAHLRWDVLLDVGPVVPGPLLRELEEVALPAWGRALANAARGA